MTFRYSPLKILYDICDIFKSNFFFILFVFIINFNSTSTFMLIVKIIISLVITVSLFLRIKETFFTTIFIKSDGFHIHTGIFSKSEQLIPRDKIENVQSSSTVLHRLFSAQQMTLETGDASTDVSLKFIRPSQVHLFAAYEGTPHIHAEKKQLERADELLLHNEEKSTEKEAAVLSSMSKEAILYTPSTFDLLKASCLSFSFLAVIPILIKFISELKLDEKMDWQQISSTLPLWGIALIIVALIVIAVSIGVIKTFKRYYRYTISMDQERIYIRQGVISNQRLSIRKEKVQAVIYSQTTYQKLLGVVTIKLLSAGEISSSNNQQINEFFPYLPMKQAAALVEQMLPNYGKQTSTYKPVKGAKWFIVVRIPYLALVVAAIGFWKPIFFIFGGIVFVLTYIYRIQQYRNSSLTFHQASIQLQTGGFTTETLVTKRAKLLELSFEQSPLQRLAQAQTIKITNRAHPVQVTSLEDFHLALTPKLKRWFEQRNEDVVIDPASQPNALKHQVVRKLLKQLKAIKKDFE